MELSAEGGCLCGALRYRVTATPTDATYCHCRMCQRRSRVPAAGFEFTQGEPAAYQSSAAAHRVFSRDCGTEIYFSLIDDPSGRSLNLGTLDDPEAVRPVEHIWTKSQLSWFDVRDSLPRHAEYED